MNRIRFLREEAGLTQEVLAKKIGVSRQVLGNYEKEINYPSPDLLCKFADFFDCSIDYLIGRSDDLGVISITNEKSSSLTKDEQSVLNAYRALPEDLQRRARVYIEKLAELVAAEQSPVRPFRA